jgi:CheY-like chemotaxis protein
VCVISTEEARERALNSGALSFVPKPIRSKDVLDALLEQVKGYTAAGSRNVLVVEPDPAKRGAIEECLNAVGELHVTLVDNGDSACAAIPGQLPDCVVLGAGAREVNAAAFVEDLQNRANGFPIPVLIYSDDRSPPAGSEWQRVAKKPAVRWVHSLERLLDQAALVLHRDTAKLPKAQRRTLEDMYQSNKQLSGKRVLIVDDDVRNIYALTSVLEQYSMNIASADNGRDAIKMLKNGSDIDIVLMDIMMPEIDGLDTTREIRKIPQCRDLPIIAVTAKAMKGDRDRCLEAGAWDYLSKPVNTDQLLSVLRLWLQR